MSERNDFISLALAGEVVSDEIDDFVEAWHGTEGATGLHEFLGMTWEEYQLWVSDPAYLSLILAARHNGIALREAVRAVNDNHASPSVARRPERTRQLQHWLAQYA